MRETGERDNKKRRGKRRCERAWLVRLVESRQPSPVLTMCRNVRIPKLRRVRVGTRVKSVSVGVRDWEDREIWGRLGWK